MSNQMKYRKMQFSLAFQADNYKVSERKPEPARVVESNQPFRSWLPQPLTGIEFTKSIA